MSEEDSELIGLDRQDLERAAVLYEDIRAQRRKKDAAKDKQLANDFMQFLESKMMNLSRIIMNQEIPKHIKSSHILNVSYQV